MANRRVSHDDVIVQLSVTVGCAYISFFVAQYIFGNTNIYANLFIIYIDLFISYTITCINYTILSIYAVFVTTHWKIEYLCETLSD